jgi:DoxX-like protein
MPPLVLTQAAVAAVWLYEGLWCKLLSGVPHQFDVVEAVPLFGAGSAAWILRAIGVVECGLALWVLSGWQPVLAAAAQTGLLVTMNSGGLLWARRIIPDPAGMIVKNFAFLVLAWVVAAQAGLAHAGG